MLLGSSFPPRKAVPFVWRHRYLADLAPDIVSSSGWKLRASTCNVRVGACVAVPESRER